MPTQKSGVLTFLVLSCDRMKILVLWFHWGVLALVTLLKGISLIWRVAHWLSVGVAWGAMLKSDLFIFDLCIQFENHIYFVLYCLVLSTICPEFLNLWAGFKKRDVVSLSRSWWVSGSAIGCPKSSLVVSCLVSPSATWVLVISQLQHFWVALLLNVYIYIYIYYNYITSKVTKLCIILYYKQKREPTFFDVIFDQQMRQDIFSIDGVKYVDYSRDLFMDLPTLIESFGTAVGDDYTANPVPGLVICETRSCF